MHYTVVASRRLLDVTLKRVEKLESCSQATLDAALNGNLHINSESIMNVSSLLLKIQLTIQFSKSLRSYHEQAHYNGVLDQGDSSALIEITQYDLQIEGQVGVFV